MKEVFSCDYFDFESIYNEEIQTKTIQDIFRTFKSLIDVGFSAFNKIKKSSNVDFYKLAKKEETPLPCSSMRYIKKYGIVDIDFYENKNLDIE